MSVSEDVARLSDQLRNSASGTRTEIQTFPSGAVWLDVHYVGRLFTLAYQPTGQYFGVDEADLEEHGIGTHFRYRFDDFKSAREKLLCLLNEAGVGQGEKKRGRDS